MRHYFNEKAEFCTLCATSEQNSPLMNLLQTKFEDLTLHENTDILRKNKNVKKV